MASRSHRSWHASAKRWGPNNSLTQIRCTQGHGQSIRSRKIKWPPCWRKAALETGQACAVFDPVRRIGVRDGGQTDVAYVIGGGSCDDVVNQGMHRAVRRVRHLACDIQRHTGARPQPAGKGDQPVALPCAVKGFITQIYGAKPPHGQPTFRAMGILPPAVNFGQEFPVGIG